MCVTLNGNSLYVVANAFNTLQTTYEGQAEKNDVRHFGCQLFIRSADRLDAYVLQPSALHRAVTVDSVQSRSYHYRAFVAALTLLARRAHEGLRLEGKWTTAEQSSMFVYSGLTPSCDKLHTADYTTGCGNDKHDMNLADRSFLQVLEHAVCKGEAKGF